MKGMQEGIVRIHKSCFVAVLTLSTMAATFAADQFVHPDLTNGKVVIHSVMILASGALVKRFGNVLGGEVLTDAGEQLGISLRQNAEKVLKVKGCDSLADSFTPEELDKDPGVKSAFTEILASYQRVELQVWKKPKDVRQGRFSLGDGVSKLNPAHEIDSFMFIGAFGSLATTGEKVKRMIEGPGNASHDALDIQIGVVDARSGAVLYFGKTITKGNFIAVPENVQHGIETALEDFTCGPLPAK